MELQKVNEILLVVATAKVNSDEAISKIATALMHIAQGIQEVQQHQANIELLLASHKK
jgi:hypothetical protein